MIDWKPIDSAPKDRPVFLFYQASPLAKNLLGETDKFGVGRWCDDADAQHPHPFWRSSAFYKISDQRAFAPTHWAECEPPRLVAGRSVKHRRAQHEKSQPRSAAPA